MNLNSDDKIAQLDHMLSEQAKMQAKIMSSGASYDEIGLATDNEQERKTMENLMAIAEADAKDPGMALQRILSQPPVFFTKEELHLAFGGDKWMEINQNGNDIRPDMITEYDNVYTNTEEFETAINKLDLMYKTQKQLGTDEMGPNHWTNKRK